MIHNTPSPLAGKTVTLKPDAIPDVRADAIPDVRGGETIAIQIEDWWDRVAGSSWMWAQGNPACMIYAIRTGFADGDIPIDDEVLYGKIDGLGYLVHVSEIEEESL